MSTLDRKWMAFKMVAAVVFSGGLLLGLPGTAAAVPSTVVCGYDNGEPQLTGGYLTDVRRGAEINMAADCKLSITGSTGSAGDLWITVLGDPTGTPPQRQCWSMEALVLIKKFDNKKAVGFVTNYDTGTKTGLFFGLYDAGNTDSLTLSTFDGNTGKLTGTLASKALGSKIKENVWYELELDTCDLSGNFNVTLSVEDADDPGEGEGDGDRCTENPSTVCLLYNGPLPGVIATRGAAGIAGYAKSAIVDSQVTSIVIVGSDPGP